MEDVGCNKHSLEMWQTPTQILFDPKNLGPEKHLTQKKFDLKYILDQNIFSDPKFGTPKKLGTNFLDPNEIFRPIDILYPQKFLDLRKFWMQKLDNVKFGSNKDFGLRKIFISKKNFYPKKIEHQNFWTPKIFQPLRILDQKFLFGLKIVF